jgi:hypothetical protein
MRLDVGYHIARSNLENLLDEENALAPGRRTDRGLRENDDIAGWRLQLRDPKIDQRASAIDED